MAGDVTDPVSLAYVLTGAKAVLVLSSGGAVPRPGEPGPEAVDHVGVDLVAQAALEAGVGRVVLLSRVGASARFGCGTRCHTSLAACLDNPLSEGATTRIRHDSCFQGKRITQDPQ